MVARIETPKGIAETLSYNEEKVAQGQAACIHVQNFLQDRNTITYPDMLDRFERLNALNTRSKVKMWHSTLNFHPSEKLSDERLTAIADRYMQGLQMDDQPYLVYRHDDANHPHVHIVSSLIRSDGSRINNFRQGLRMSEPTRKGIEQEFQLIPGQRKRQTTIPPLGEMRKIDPASGIPVTESMDRLINGVMRHYNFTNLQEYNAILRGYNITAETGGPGSKTRRHNGIFYLALDDRGERISPPVMASQLPCRPTQSRLNKKYQESKTQRPAHLLSIKSRIDWALDQQPASLRTLVSRLQSDAIEIVRPPSNGRNPHDQVFVDYQTRSAVTGETLGPAYTTAAVSAAIAGSQRPAQQKRQQAKTQPDTRYSANVPQVLSSVLHTEPAGPTPFGQRQGQHLGQRK